MLEQERDEWTRQKHSLEVVRELDAPTKHVPNVLDASTHASEGAIEPTELMQVAHSLVTL